MNGNGNGNGDGDGDGDGACCARQTGEAGASSGASEGFGRLEAAGTGGVQRIKVPVANVPFCVKSRIPGMESPAEWLQLVEMRHNQIG